MACFKICVFNLNTDDRFLYVISLGFKSHYYIHAFIKDVLYVATYTDRI